jgi:carbamoyl-phosphate synthase/aspartate carbamoyltransferase/dihydroorotase
VRLGGFGLMKPSLKTQKDQDFLWGHLDYIDVVESDHAPHTRKEKLADPPAFGVPGLETTLPLLLTSVSQGKLTLEKIIELCSTNPAKLLSLSIDKETKLEVDMDEELTIEGANLKTKCKWTPFEGMKVKGKVKNVFIRGKKVFSDDTILARAGSGRVI